MESFSEWLFGQLHNHDITPAELARKSGVSQPVISRILSNDRNPSPNTLQKIAKGLHLSIQEVYLAAGILPTGQEIKDSLADRFAEILYELPDDDVDDLYTLALAKLERHKRNR